MVASIAWDTPLATELTLSQIVASDLIPNQVLIKLILNIKPRCEANVGHLEINATPKKSFWSKLVSNHGFETK